MGRIRIIAGEFGGRRIEVPEGPGVRPTSDRVREALFAILAGRTAGARVLDAFAGSGALGIEALSRGASEVLFIESDERIARTLRENVRLLALESRCTIRLSDSSEWLTGRAPRVPFDLVLADPPYRAFDPEPFLHLAASPDWLAPGGWLVMERERESPDLEDAGHGVVRFRSTIYGRTRLDFYHASGG